MSASIFISFAAQDRKVANTLCQALESRGFKCWISSRDILPGENFQIAIVRSIRKAKLMLLVFTANSNNSEEMNKELALASQQKLTVVPLRIEDVAPNDAFAYEFATRQWIDFFADWELAMGALASQIANVLGPDAPPAVIPGAPTAPAAVEPPVVAERVADLAGATMIAPPSFRAAPEPAPAEPAAEPVADLAPTPEPEAVQAPEPKETAEPPAEVIAEPINAWTAELPPEPAEVVAPALAEPAPEADFEWGAAPDLKADLADPVAPDSHAPDSHAPDFHSPEFHAEELRPDEAHGTRIEDTGTAPPLSAAALLADVQAQPEKSATVHDHAHAVETPARKKGSPLPLIIGAVVLLAAAAAGVVWFLNKAPDDAAANPPVAATPAALAPTVAPPAESAAPATPIAASPALPAAATAAPATAGADTSAATAATDAATAATAAPKAARHRPKAESQGPAPLRASRSDIPY